MGVSCSRTNEGIAMSVLMSGGSSPVIQNGIGSSDYPGGGALALGGKQPMASGGSRGAQKRRATSMETQEGRNGGISSSTEKVGG